MQGAAASARLCIETLSIFVKNNFTAQPPPRGCVLKLVTVYVDEREKQQPPPRGCVLKQSGAGSERIITASSRLRAAVY